MLAAGQPPAVVTYVRNKMADGLPYRRVIARERGITRQLINSERGDSVDSLVAHQHEIPGEIDSERVRSIMTADRETARRALVAFFGPVFTAGIEMRAGRIHCEDGRAGSSRHSIASRQ